MGFQTFELERWQSSYEHEVAYNLAESGVEPLTLAELLEVTGLSTAALKAATLGYNPTNGSPELRQRIADLYPGACPGNVLITSGGAEANYLAAWYLLGGGGALVYTAPTYMQVPGLARSLGAEAVAWWLRESARWQPDLDDLERLVTNATRAILVTNPNNPTGAVFREEMLEGIVRVAEHVGAWVIADEVYRGAERGGATTPTLWGRYPRVLATGGLSKAYGLPGLRVGWVVGPERTIEELWARKDYTTVAIGRLSDLLAAAVLTEGPRRELLQRTRRIVASNWSVLESWLQAWSDAFRWVAPEAGAIAYVRRLLPVASLELAERLRQEADCLLVPGEHFGMPGYLRIGFGLAAADLRAALGRCAAVLDGLRAAGRRSHGASR